MNRLSTSDRARAIACLVDGNSQRATCRIMDLSRKAVARLAEEIGEACQRFSDRIMVALPCERIQCDEIWSFIGATAPCAIWLASSFFFLGPRGSRSQIT